MWLKGETLVLIGRDTLQQFVAEYVVTPKAVFTDSGELAVRFEPYAINEVEIRLLLGGKSPQEGGLKFRLPLSQMPPSPVVQPEPPVRAGAEDAAARVSHSALAAR